MSDDRWIPIDAPSVTMVASVCVFTSDGACHHILRDDPRFAEILQKTLDNAGANLPSEPPANEDAGQEKLAGILRSLGLDGIMRSDGKIYTLDDLENDNG